MQQISPDLWLICTIFAACFGACVGSFLNVCIYRIPLDQSVVTPRSHCMSCNSLIPWYHNIPIFSYFILKGKCANCKASFSFRYAGIELLTSFLFVVICCMFPPKGAVAPLYLNTIPDIAAVPVLWVFISGLIIATFVDFDHFIIPDSVSIGGMVAGIILSALVPSLHGQSLWTNGLIASVTGLLAGFLPLQFVRVGSTFLYRKLGRIDNDEYAMGFGDIKLIGAIGAFTGWQGAVFAMISAAFYGTIIAIPFLVSGRKKLIDRIPFGPYLALGALTWIFWSERILYFYFGLLRPPA